MNEPEMLPYDIAKTLFRALVWCGDQITEEDRENAWAYLEDRNPHEFFGD